MLSRLKFEIAPLVNEILDQLPAEVWTSDTTTFLDPAIAGGQFIRVIEQRLRTAGHSDDNINGRVYGCENSKLSVQYAKTKYNLVSTLGVGDFLEKDFGNMKFDVIVGNPPYQKDSGNAGAGQTLWDLFVKKSKMILMNDGFMAMIHPAGWRNDGGSFKSVRDILNNMTIRYLQINDIDAGIKTFGAATRYDVYVAQNKISENHVTKIIGDDGNVYYADLKKLSFIPNFDFDLFQNLLAKDGEERVTLISSRSMYGADKKHMSKNKTKKNKWPCVKYISKKENNSIDFYYADADLGMFGIPKVMFGTGSQVGGIIIDSTGEYGMCQFVCGITDDVENLPNIQKALISEKFKRVMSAVQFTTQMYNYRVIGKFRKDFWKDFM